MRRASDIATLGPGFNDGEFALLEYGDQTAELSWHEAAEEWVGLPATTIRLREIEPMNVGSVTETGWQYLSFPKASPDVGSWGWQPESILDALAAYNAGLRLQEKLTWTMWSWNSTSDPANNGAQLVIAYYGFDDGESIGPWIEPDEVSPNRNLGTPIYALSGQRRWMSTGWVDCPIDPPDKDHLAPHFYSRRRTGDQDIRFDGLSTEWRWAGALA